MDNAPSKARHFSLHFLSVAAVLGCDWFVYTGNMLTHLEAVTAWVVTGSVTAALITSLIERHLRGASWRATVVKGGLAGALVAAPFPVLGTVVGALALAWGIAAAVAHAAGEFRSAAKARS